MCRLTPTDGSFALQNLAVSFADKPDMRLVRVAKLWTLDNIVRVNGRMAISTPKAYLYFSFFILHYSLFIACSGKAAANSGLSREQLYDIGISY